MADVEKAAEKGWSAIKNNAWFFVVCALAIVVLTLAYDYRNQGKLTVKVAKWPLVGGWFKPSTGAGAGAAAS